MSDTREIIYNSPSMGRVTLVRVEKREDVLGRHSTVAALECCLLNEGAYGSLFHLFAPDFDAIAAELERTGSLART